MGNTAFSAKFIEVCFPEGTCVGVDHNMNRVLKGGAFVAMSANNAQPGDHPEDTKVPFRKELSGKA